MTKSQVAFGVLATAATFAAGHRDARAATPNGSGSGPPRNAHTSRADLGSRLPAVSGRRAFSMPITVGYTSRATPVGSDRSWEGRNALGKRDT
jgi:hypothetical protein